MNFFDEIKLEKKFNLITANFYKEFDSCPSRIKLSDFILKSFNYSNINNLKIDSLFEVSQIFVDQVVCTKSTLLKKLQFIYENKVLDLEPVNFLIDNNKISSIINLNYDDSFCNNPKSKKISPFVQTSFTVGKTKIYKPFGDLVTPDTCVITKQDFRRLKVLPFYKSYFDGIKYELKLRKNIIFAFDVEDSDFFETLEFIFGDYPNSLKEIYMVTKDKITDVKVLNFIEKYNIQILNYDSFDFITKLKNCLDEENHNEIQSENEILEKENNTEVQFSLFKTEIQEDNSQEDNFIELKETKNIQEEELKNNIETEVLTQAKLLTEEKLEIPQEEIIAENPVNLEKDNVEEEIIEEYIPKNIIIEDNFFLETALQKKYSSSGLNSFPISASNIPENIDFSNIEVVGNAEMKIGEHTNSCFMRILSTEDKKISLLEIKSRELKLRFSIIYDTPGMFKVTNDYLQYEISTNVTHGRAIVVLEMLESLFSGIAMEFSFKNLSGQISLNNPIELIKIKTALNLFKIAKSNGIKIQMNKLENIEDIFYKLNLEILTKDESYSTWCNYEIDKNDINPQDTLTFKRINILDKRNCIEETIILKKPVLEKDISENKIIGKSKVCIVHLKKLRGEF